MMRRFIDIVSGHQPVETKGSNLLRLLEAKAHEDMLRGLETILQSIDPKEIPYDELAAAPEILKTIKGTAKSLRQDRAVWFTREARALLALSLSNIFVEMGGEHPLGAKAIALSTKYLNDYQRATGEELNTGQMGHPVGFTMWNAKQKIRDLVNYLEHWKGVPYQPLQDYTFEASASYHKILVDMRAIEQKFKDRAAGSVTLQEGDEIILTFPKRGEEPQRFWILLSRASCPKEASAMGHCGNSPREGSNDRIISLREFSFNQDGVDYYRPCLTFILEADGHLGEMKGRGNEKPAAHYHDEIEALLRLPLIKGLRGGGYLQYNNFALADMSDEQRIALARDKPELLTPKERYDTFGLDESLMETIRGIFEADENDPASLSRYRKIGQYLKKIGISTDDHDKLTARYPEMRTPLEKYEESGLSEELLKEIKISIDKVSASETFKGLSGYLWFDRESFSTVGFTPAIMTKEQRETLFRRIPDAMSPAARYEMEGLTDVVIDYIKEAFVESGVPGLVSVIPDFDKIPEADKTRLNSEGLAPFSYQLSVSGPTAEFVTRAEEYIEENSYNLFQMPIYNDEKDHFVIVEYSDTEEMIKSIGDSKFKQYSATDQDHFDTYVDDNHYHVESFDDVLGYQKLSALRQYAEKLLRENIDDEEELEDRLENIDSWSGIYAVFGEFDDTGIQQIVRGAVASGEEAGAEDQLWDAKQSALKNSEMLYDSKFIYTTYKPDDNIDLSEKVTLVVSPSGIAKILDTEPEFEYGPEFFLKGEEITLNVPYNGFENFSEEVALESFVSNLSEFAQDIEDMFEENPYMETGQLKKMSDKVLVRELSKLYKKMDRELNQVSGKTSEQLTNMFKSAMVSYYGK